MTSATRLNPLRHRGGARGMTLIEVLVALVVLAVGMLGVGALYLDSLRGGRSALYNAQAINLAADLSEVLRSAQGTCTPGSGQTTCTLTASSLNAPFNTLYTNWSTSVGTNLPGGSQTVTVTPSTTSTAYKIILSWKEPGATADSTYTLEFER